MNYMQLIHEHFRAHMKTVQPDVDMDIEFIDEETGDPFTLMALPDRSQLFLA
jgi:hypothetical protein